MIQLWENYGTLFYLQDSLRDAVEQAAPAKETSAQAKGDLCDNGMSERALSVHNVSFKTSLLLLVRAYAAGCSRLYVLKLHISETRFEDLTSTIVRSAAAWNPKAYIAWSLLLQNWVRQPCTWLEHPPAVLAAHIKLERLAASKVDFRAPAFSNTLPHSLRVCVCAHVRVYVCTYMCLGGCEHLVCV